MSSAEPPQKKSRQEKVLFRSSVAQISGCGLNISTSVSHPAQGNFVNQLSWSNTLLHEGGADDDFK